MNVSFSCPRCGKHVVAKASSAGERRKCPNPDCGATLTVPAQSAKRPNGSRPPVAESRRGALLFGTKRREEENLIDMTAMVDIVFFLLIFFMVTSIQSLESVIELPAPRSSSSSGVDPTPVDFDSDPAYVRVAIESDDTVWVEGEQVFGGPDLRDAIKGIAKERGELLGMVIQGDPEASHGTLVMVLDAGAEARLKDLRFSVAEVDQAE
ncbi:MAG: biopolymer transporter ExbD [Lacipirellulaceae bacterium]